MFEIYDPYLVNNVKYLVYPINVCQQQRLTTKTKVMCFHTFKEIRFVPSKKWTKTYVNEFLKFHCFQNIKVEQRKVVLKTFISIEYIYNISISF